MLVIDRIVAVGVICCTLTLGGIFVVAAVDRVFREDRVLYESYQPVECTKVRCPRCGCTFCVKSTGETGEVVGEKAK